MRPNGQKTLTILLNYADGCGILMGSQGNRRLLTVPVRYPHLISFFKEPAMTRRSCLLLPLAALLALSGCSKKKVSPPHAHSPDFEITLCGLCGEVKGTEKCCKEGIALCPNCGLHKGSVLCCSSALTSRRDVLLCMKCGERKFTKKCCQEDIALCPKCGLHKGSPGCCKIVGIPSDAAREEQESAKKLAKYYSARN
jgi:hypothetical protein